MGASINNEDNHSVVFEESEIYHQPHHDYTSAPINLNITVNNYYAHHCHSHCVTTSAFSNKPTVRVVCKADPSYALSIRHGTVILALGNPNDPYQVTP